MSSTSELPRISWEDLELGNEMHLGREFTIFRGWLELPNNRGRVPVIYKMGKWNLLTTTDDFLDEGRLLQTVKGLSNVPQFYGITATPPFALVTSRCGGSPLKRFQRKGAARVYLEALREVCLILGRVHRRGVVHCNVNENTILVQFKGDPEEIITSLVGFRNGMFPEDKEMLKFDSKQVMALVNVMGTKLKEPSELFEHRDKLLAERELNLTGILRLLCSVLHGDPYKCVKCKNLRPGN